MKFLFPFILISLTIIGAFIAVWLTNRKIMREAKVGEMTDYEAVGGAPAVSVVVGDFYDRVLDDIELAPYFAESDMARVRRHQFLVISEAMGGPIAEGVMSVAEAHKGRGITENALSRVATHLLAAMNAAKWPEEIVQRTAQAVMSFRHQVVER